MPKLSPNTEYAVVGVLLSLVIAVLYATIPVLLVKGMIPADMRWIAGALLAAPFVVLHYMVYRLMRRSDEFLRTVIAKRLIVTTLLLPATTLYGLSQTFAHGPVIPITFAGAVFWVIYAIVCLFVHGSRVPTSE
jgi:predicted outer membrane lipoprotein